MNRNEFSGWKRGNRLKKDYNLMRMKGSGDDCNCETQTRGDVSDTGVRPNEMRSRIQGIADSHDSSPTLRLSEEIKIIKQIMQINSFHKRIHRLIQHHKRSQSSKQHTL